MEYWEIIADNLHDAGWSLGWVSAVDSQGRTIWIVDAHGYGKRFVVRADEKLTAFVELQRAIHEFAVSSINGPSATQSGLADWAHRGFMQITTGWLRSGP